MIAAISLMRRRPDLSVELFRRHWLHPHGTMTAELPGLRHYVQHHPFDAPGTNDRTIASFDPARMLPSICSVFVLDRKHPICNSLRGRRREWVACTTSH